MGDKLEQMANEYLLQWESSAIQSYRVSNCFLTIFMSKQLKSHLQWRRVLKAESTWRINLESGRAVAKLPVAA